ncbi:flagellin [Porticoccaceae bacterium]|nr:flagellin [Porticoccaceae bacterium]
MTVINTNTAATITANAITKNERAMTQTMERLSTGQRINSAADDAAGLAISSRMTSQINGLNMAVRNANDAISMVHTEEGAMIEVSNMLQRMRELAVQASSGTMSATDRDALQVEFAALSAQIQQVGDDTTWNGKLILDGAGVSGAQSFQVGANASQTIDHTFAVIESSDVASQTHVEAQATDQDGSNAEVQTLTLGGGTFAVGDTIHFQIDGVKFGAEVMALDGATIESVRVHGSSTTVSNDSDTTDQFTTTSTSGNITLSIATDNVLTFTGTTTTVSAGFEVNDGSGLVKRGITAAVTAVDVDTAANAANAISSLDVAIKAVDSARASSGAVINRLEYAADNLANVSQNTSASRSRILDADYAAETTELARTQIIQQAGTAMLSQANQQAQSVLALLK